MLRQVQINEKIKKLAKVQMECRWYHCEWKRRCLLKFGALIPFALYGESGNSRGESLMESFILVECFGKKGNTPAFRSITFFSVLTWKTEIFCTICLYYQWKASFLEKAKNYRYFVNGHHTMPFLISVWKKYQFYLTEDFLSKFPHQR